jgi:uridine kinase
MKLASLQNIQVYYLTYNVSNLAVNKPYIIGITGGSGSGKTTFLSTLKNSFREEDMCILSSDNYYKPKEQQEIDAMGVSNFDLPTSIHREEFFEDIQKLVAGEVVTRQEYTFNNALKEPKILTFKPAPILVLEGIFVFHFPEIIDLIDLKLFLYATETTALTRRIKRDKIERNYPLEDVLYRYEKHVLPTYRKYIEPIMEQADLIINNNHNFESGLNVLSGFLHNQLNRHSVSE